MADEADQLLSEVDEGLKEEKAKQAAANKAENNPLPYPEKKGSFAKGGTVKETGMYKLHKGEEVVPKGRASEYRKVFLQRGKDGKHNHGK